jgi:hypothetical protein
MTNSKLAKKKKARKMVEYSLDDIESDDEWIVNNDERSFENEIWDLTIEVEDLEGSETQNNGDNGAATASAENDLEGSKTQNNMEIIKLFFLIFFFLS